MDPVYLILAAVVFFFVARSLWQARPTIAPVEANAAIKSGNAVLIDVRESGEWSSGVAQSAALLALSDLRGSRTKWEPFLKAHRDKQLVLYCVSGTRSGIAAGLLRREGFNAVNLGGLSRWTSAGLPLSRP
jgi:rhodanese-related sulfurtransferase|uniref:rhodanese-like domain-containing protein n=1 Tax=Cephaloticoccus sp. TaxID=1985742 RepID=UPI00404A4FA4